MTLSGLIAVIRLTVALKEEVDLVGALLLDALSLADLVATLSGCCIRLESGNLYSVQLSQSIKSPCRLRTESSARLSGQGSW